MDIPFTRTALVSSLVAYALLALVLPMLRHRLQHGEGTGLMLARLEDPVSRVVGVAMAFQNFSVITFSILYWQVGAEPLDVYTSAPGWAAYVGMGFFALAAVVTVIGQAQMGKSWRMCVDLGHTELVTGGLFAFCRNPLYSATNALLLGMFCIAPSPWTVALFVMGVLLVALQARLEEAHLKDLHGDSYADYAARVGRFVPLLGRIPRETGGERAPGGDAGAG